MRFPLPSPRIVLDALARPEGALVVVKLDGLRLALTAEQAEELGRGLMRCAALVSERPEASPLERKDQERGEGASSRA